MNSPQPLTSIMGRWRTLSKWQPPDLESKPAVWICPTCQTTYKPRWLGERWASPQTYCDVCRQAVWLRQLRQQHQADLLHKYGLDQGLYAAMTWEAYKPRSEAQKVAKAAVGQLVCDWKRGNWRQGLLLSGPLGVGKTHLMVVAARWACVVAFRSIALWDMPTWVQAVKNSYDTGGTASILTAAKEPDVLFLDDVGAEQGNQPWLSDLYYQIINSRYVAQQTIVATTNLTASGLLARYPRAADRLLEITGPPIQMDGQSYRQLRLAGEV